jgi:glucoamylase
VSLGSCRQSAQSTLLQALGVPFAEQRERFLEQWHRVCGHITSKPMPSDGHALFRRSHSLLLAHEDKSFSGAMIASLSIPWGEAKSDEDLGGYHLVWPRDMAHSATALLASGNTDTPYRALIYLASIQATNGGFHQNFWIDGEPFWTGVQLDQVSFMILLAWRVARAGALKEFDPYPMVLRAAAFLIAEGPATGQERWEENSGYSPSTLAANIAALCCAAKMAQQRNDQATARFLQDYADFLESHLDGWTTTTQGTLVPGISRHYIRILPIDLGNPMAMEDPSRALIEIKNRPPGAPWVFPAKEIVDGGFLELVRYGIRKPDDPLVVDSLAVVDRVLKVETPYGPCWRRYNHDGYGQRDDGGPFLGWGRGRGWPLLAGERGHYELAAGHDARPYLRALEQFAQDGLLSEQVWDADDRPDDRLWRGRPTGAAMPLVWAHAEYMTLVRSVADGKVYDLIDHVAERYQSPTKPLAPEVWKPQRHARSITPGQTLRVMANEPFLLHWTANNWQQIDDTPSTPTKLGLHFVDVTTEVHQAAPIRFTFFWLDSKRWEGRDCAVSIDPHAGA